MNPPASPPPPPPPPHQAMLLNTKSLKTKFALKFLRALRNISHQESKKNNDNIGSTFMVAQRYHKVKVAAEASMASAVGPRRAWSRAILIRVRPRSVAQVMPMRRMRRRRRRGAGSARGHEQLRRLVPGGEAMDMKRLLDETAHYIKCLSTQVKIMRGIVNYYSSSTT